MVDALAGEQRADHVEPLVEPLGARVRVLVLAEALELAVAAAETRAEDDAAGSEPVERGQLVRDHLRPPARDRRDAGPDQDPLGGHGHRSERHPRVGRRLVPDEREVVPDQVRVPPGALGGLRDADGGAGLGVRADVRAEDPELHGSRRYPSKSTSSPTCRTDVRVSSRNAREVVEEVRPLARELRRHEEQQLVDQPALEERRRDRRAAFEQERLHALRRPARAAPRRARPSAARSSEPSGSGPSPNAIRRG